MGQILSTDWSALDSCKTHYSYYPVNRECSWKKTQIEKIQVHSFFIVSRLSTEIQLSIQGLLIVIRNPIRNACFGIVKHDWTSIVWHWTNRKYFLFARGNISNSKGAFYNKKTCLLRYGCFNRYLSVVTLVDLSIL